MTVQPKITLHSKEQPVGYQLPNTVHRTIIAETRVHLKGCRVKKARRIRKGFQSSDPCRPMKLALIRTNDYLNGRLPRNYQCWWHGFHFHRYFVSSRKSLVRAHTDSFILHDRSSSAVIVFQRGAA